MSKKDPAIEINTSDFQIKLHPTHLEVDLQQGTRRRLEDALNAHATLKESLGFILEHVVHMDVALKDIEKVELDSKKNVKIIIPHRRDITIPVEHEAAVKLINKLNELIPIEKQKESDRIRREYETRRQLEREGLTVEGLKESESRLQARKRD